MYVVLGFLVADIYRNARGQWHPPRGASDPIKTRQAQKITLA